MRTLFVSRHPGAIQWIKSQPIKIDYFIAHLELGLVQPGDRIIGSLPVNMVAKVCALKAEYWNLSLEMPPELRGQELSKEQLDQLSVCIERYEVTRCQSEYLLTD